MKTTSLISILPIIFLLFPTTYGKVIYVDSTVSDQQNTYQTIQKGINAAKAGDEVVIKKGSYAENIIVKIPLSLRGELNEVVTITGNPNSKNATLCEVNNVTGCSLENIIFNPSGGGATKKPVVHLKGGAVTVKNCTVEKAKAAGISCTDGCKALITNCTVKESRGSGLDSGTGQTHVKINNSRFLNNKQCGVYFNGDTELTASNCIFEGNKISGVKATKERTHVFLKGCKSINNGGSGVSIMKDATGNIQDCEFELNKNGVFGAETTNISITNNLIKQSKEHGIRLHEVQSSTLSHNQCKGNGKNGIYIYKGTNSILSENTCTQNSECGFSFRGGKLKVEAIKNVSHMNKWQGFYAGPGVEGSLIQNTVSENDLNGIYVVGSDVSLQQNECRGNKISGIRFGDGSMGSIKENRCQDNQLYGIQVADIYSAPALKSNHCENNTKGEIYWANEPVGPVRKMLLDGKYDELEQLIDKLKNEEIRNENGGFLSWQYYGLLSEKIGTRSHENQEKYIAAIKKWIDTNPDSVTPRIVLAKTYVQLGWHHRGIGLANTVTEEGWRMLDKYLNMALSVLDEAERLKDQDPELYHCYLTVGRGLSKPLEWMEEKFQKGISIQNNYHYLYNNMVEYLQPKWHGNKQEMLDFAERACDLTKEKEGNTIYARIVGSAYHCNGAEYFFKLGFPYDKIKSSFEELLEQYPKSYRNMNRLCVFACMYDDRETARELFKKIDNNAVAEIWKNDNEYFNQAKAWAFSDDKPTEKEGVVK